MSDNRQLLYFSRLAELGVNKEIFITLPEVAEIMFTSNRHCRTLLNQLNQLGWIEWKPKSGRNQRSQLYLNYTVNNIKNQLAQQLISKGKYEKALDLIDNDQQLFAQLLKNTSGPQRREGRLHVQLTYDRAFSLLLPHCPLRNSERFLLRQVYSCLVQCDENGNIKPELAHNWTYNKSELSWKFYLRPQLKFHDGSDITASVITDLFKQLKHMLLYKNELSHIESICELNPLCIQFTLTKPDEGFAALLSDVKYAIQPPKQLSETNITTNNRSVTGSGVFQVQEHSEQKLTLQAYDHFHGFRALTDTVTIWQLSKQENSTFGDTKLETARVTPAGSMCSNYLSVEGASDENDQLIASSEQTSRIEDGCLLAMVNSQAELSLLQRKYLSQLIGSESLLKQLTQSDDDIAAVAAYNLLPGWLTLLPSVPVAHPLPDSLTIAIFEHHALKQCAEAMMTQLNSAGVHCTINIYSFNDFYEKAQNQSLNEDIILTSMNLDDNRPISAFCWMLSNPFLQQSLSYQDKEWLASKLYYLREQQPVSSYMRELESVASALITSHKLIPIFHHKQTLRFEDVLKSVSINTWGWPELRDIWTDE